MKRLRPSLRRASELVKDVDSRCHAFHQPVRYVRGAEYRLILHSPNAVQRRFAHLSDRASQNLQKGRLREVRAYCYYNQYDPVRNPDGIVAMALAENKLMRDEITKHINDNFRVTPWHLTYGEGAGGTTELRTEIASFVNEVFSPHTLVEKDHVCMCNGAGSGLHNFCFCIGEPGEGILVGRPLYPGFFGDIEAAAKIKPVLVAMSGADPTSVEAVQRYEETLTESERSGTKIRAILLANPHNPLGRPYTKEALEGYLRLCNKYNIHLISDEVYAKSWFPSDDFPNPPPFVSVLSFDLKKYIDPALVHVLYALSKDFCANGVRIGCIISPFNKPMLKAFRSITDFTRPSQLAEQVWLDLLNDRPFHEYYFPELQGRMTDAYTYVTNELKRRHIPYTPASVSSFLWVDLSEYLDEDTEDAELALNWRMAEAKVWIAMGAVFGSEKHGNYRITFATPRHELELGLDRLFNVLTEVKEEKRKKSEAAANQSLTGNDNFYVLAFNLVKHVNDFQMQSRLEVVGWISFAVLLIAALFSVFGSLQSHSDKTMTVESRIATVTGANKGIGLAIVRNLALNYSKSPLKSGPFLIYLTARSPERGAEAVQTLNQDPELKKAKALSQDGGSTTITYHELDVSKSKSIQQFRDFLKKEHPSGIDIVINNAGIRIRGIAMQGFNSSVVHDTLLTNYYGTLEANNELLPLLRRGGRMVNVASMGGHLNKYSNEVRDAFLKAAETDVPSITAIMQQYQTAADENKVESSGFPAAAYCVSKAGVIGFTRALALEEQKKGNSVLVNSCCPGFVQTDMTRNRGGKTPDQGAKTPVMLALDDIGGRTGEFWQNEKVIKW